MNKKKDEESGIFLRCAAAILLITGAVELCFLFWYCTEHAVLLRYCTPAFTFVYGVELGIFYLALRRREGAKGTFHPARLLFLLLPMLLIAAFFCLAPYYSRFSMTKYFVEIWTFSAFYGYERVSLTLACMTAGFLLIYTFGGEQRASGWGEWKKCAAAAAVLLPLTLLLNLLLEKVFVRAGIFTEGKYFLYGAAAFLLNVATGGVLGALSRGALPKLRFRERLTTESCRTLLLLGVLPVFLDLVLYAAVIPFQVLGSAWLPVMTLLSFLTRSGLVQAVQFLFGLVLVRQQAGDVSARSGKVPASPI